MKTTIPLTSTVALALVMQTAVRAQATPFEDAAGSAPPPSTFSSDFHVSDRERSLAEVRPASEPLRVTGAAREVLGMHLNGVTSDVILAYIEESGRTFYVVPAEIVELSQAGLPSALIVAMIRQGSKAVTERDQSPADTPKADIPRASDPPQVSTEPIYVTGPRARGEVVYNPFLYGCPPDAYTSPWFNGRYGYYPFSYYRRYQFSSWSHPNRWSAGVRYSPYAYRGGLSYKPLARPHLARSSFHSSFLRYRCQ